jgi:hypothetical protein
LERETFLLPLLWLSAVVWGSKNAATALQNAHLQAIKGRRTRNGCLIFLQNTNDLSSHNLDHFIVCNLNLETDLHQNTEIWAEQINHMA